MTPHVAQKKHSAIDGRTTRHAGCLVATVYNLVRIADLRSEPEAGPVSPG